MFYVYVGKFIWLVSLVLMASVLCMFVQWNLSNFDINGPNKSALYRNGVLISEVVRYANVSFLRQLNVS